MQAFGESPPDAEASPFDRPNWESIAETIHCPLCEYDLRGLKDPTCPECGYRFAWRDMLDPARRKHPYLFECHPDRNVWSFLKTTFHTLRPVQFWKGLRADQPCHRHRLNTYWQIVALVVILAFATEYLAVCTADYAGKMLYAYRRGITTNYIVSSYPTPQWEPLTDSGTLLFIATPLLIVFAWPWLSYAALLLLRTSMRKARIRNEHVSRCVIYSWGIVFWIAVVLIGCDVAGSVAAAFELNAPPVFRSNDGLLLLVHAEVWLGIMIPVFISRLIVAYWRYLRFRHVIATILLTQFIVALFVFAGILYGGWLINGSP